MMGSPGLEHLSGTPDLKYSAPECYSPKLFVNDHHRDYKGEHDSNLVLKMSMSKYPIWFQQVCWV